MSPAAAAARFVKLQLEMGSKNPLVIMDDADLDRAVDLAVNGAFGGTGQKCTASSRLIVHRPIHDAFVDRFLAKTKALKVGHALGEGVQMGPVVSQAQLDSNLAYVDLARSEGGELATGGHNSTGRKRATTWPRLSSSTRSPGCASIRRKCSGRSPA